MKVCRLKKPQLIYGFEVPDDHWHEVVAERAIAVEVALLVRGGKYVATLLKEHVVFSHKPGVTEMTTTETKTDIPVTAKQRALERKQKAIDIADSAARIIMEAKKTRETISEQLGRKEKKKKEVAEKVESGDLVPLKAICRDLDIEPRIARRILRDAKVDRTEGRWEWSKADASKIEALLKEASK